MRSTLPWCSTSRPSASSLITCIASAMVARFIGCCPMTRRAESPRPIPHTVRLPNMSLSVANSEAVTDQSLVPGVVTLGRPLRRDGGPKDREENDERLLPQHVRVEGPAVPETLVLGCAHPV